MHGHDQNLSIFAGLTISRDTGPQAALLRLVLVSLHSKDVAERTAGFYAFAWLALVLNSKFLERQRGTASCFGINNSPFARPRRGYVRPSMVETVSIGGQITKAIFGWETDVRPDVISTWFGCLALGALLKENEMAKDLVHKIPLDIPRPGMPLVNLLTKVVRSTVKSARSVPSVWRSLY